MVTQQGKAAASSVLLMVAQVLARAKALQVTCTKWLGASRCVAVWAFMRSQLMLATSPLLRWPRNVRKSGPRPSVEPQASESVLMPSVRSMIFCAQAWLGSWPASANECL